MQAATRAGIDAIAADCGGSLTCATCHVMLEGDGMDRFPAPTGDELSMLDMTAEPRQRHSRLSCQLTLTAAHDGLTIRLPATQY